MQLTILIDFHNLFSMLDKDKSKTEDALAEVVRMGRRRGEIVEARLFVPIYFFDHKEDQEMWRWINSMLLKFGLTLEGCPVSSIIRSVDKVTRAKDSVDSRVSMFVVNHLHKDVGPELIVFVTGDGDFLEFSNKAQNKGKKTEFWSVDPGSTNRFIKREGNFTQIEVASPSLQDNIFLIALNKQVKNLPLSEEERRSLELVVGMADLQLQGRDSEDMTILMSEHLGISYAQSERLLEMLTTLKIAEFTPATKWVVSVDYLHGLFQYLRSRIAPREAVP